MFTLQNVLIVALVVALILGVQIYAGRRQKAKELAARQQAEAKAADLTCERESESILRTAR